ncbi:hypothetical protein DO72_4990 [Burkholderia pseudomallei]|nr:hypothetical protein DO72_4990 [Burkholderia pseudomallei]
MHLSETAPRVLLPNAPSNAFSNCVRVTVLPAFDWRNVLNDVVDRRLTIPVALFQYASADGACAQVPCLYHSCLSRHDATPGMYVESAASVDELTGYASMLHHW